MSNYTFTPRTIAQIQTQILQSIAGNPTLSALLTSTSMVSVWNLFTFIYATCVSLLEQILAIFLGEMETIIGQSVPGTAPWVQAQALLFEYNSSTADVVQVNPDFTVGYANPTIGDQIISQAAVQIGTSGQVLIKVATGTPPAPLTSLQLQAFNSYLQTILPAGMLIQTLSISADILQLNANIYYNGQFTPVISQNVIAALNTYLSSLPFNGYIRTTDVIEAIKAVPGVIDVNISNLLCTATISGSIPVYLVQSETTINREYATYSGYIVNDPSHLFVNTLTFNVATA